MSGSVVHFARVLLFSYGINAGNLQQIIIKIFSLVYLNFGKLQSNTFTEKIPKISTDLENELNYQLAHKMAAIANVSAQCKILTFIL